MEEKVRMWWDMLSEEEQNILKEVLYDLDLKDYVDMDKDGNITGRIK